VGITFPKNYQNKLEVNNFFASTKLTSHGKIIYHYILQQNLLQNPHKSSVNRTDLHISEFTDCQGDTASLCLLLSSLARVRFCSGHFGWASSRSYNEPRAGYTVHYRSSYGRCFLMKVFVKCGLTDYCCVEVLWSFGSPTSVALTSSKVYFGFMDSFWMYRTKRRLKIKYHIDECFIQGDRKAMQPISDACSVCQKINYIEIRKNSVIWSVVNIPCVQLCVLQSFPHVWCNPVNSSCFTETFHQTRHGRFAWHGRIGKCIPKLVPEI
jgi:hypothetical protein